jgi:gliding motility-associated lipoprotein GldD
MYKNYIIFLIGFFINLVGCTQHLPKDKAYPRVYLPKKEYVNYSSECGYSFQIPKYATVENKDYFRNERLESDSCWVNIAFPSFNGKLHISFKNYPNPDTLSRMMEDHYRLTSKHTIKATYIRDSIIDLPNLKGLIYSVGGNAASDKQFVLTDYKNRFIRGAMYYSNRPNADSMRPVIDFVDRDIMHLIHTFKFD